MQVLSKMSKGKSRMCGIAFMLAEGATAAAMACTFDGLERPMGLNSVIMVSAKYTGT